MDPAAERGQRIKDLIADTGLRKGEIAARIGVTPRTLQLWQKGKPIDDLNLLALADILHTTPEYILEGATNGHTPANVINEGAVQRLLGRQQEQLDLLRKHHAATQTADATATARLAKIEADVTALRGVTESLLEGQLEMRRLLDGLPAAAAPARRGTGAPARRRGGGKGS